MPLDPTQTMEPRPVQMTPAVEPRPVQDLTVSVDTRPVTAKQPLAPESGDESGSEEEALSGAEKVGYAAAGIVVVGLGWWAYRRYS